jgi:predicted NUDIX family NTP pyrophosphohydrolase
VTVRSAALALVRRGALEPEVLLLHPGGPFWAAKNEGVWTLPKGLVEPGEREEDAAKREFSEETGQRAPIGPIVPLGEVVMKSGKHIVGFATLGDFDVSGLKSNEVQMEFKGRAIRFPEADRAQWCPLQEARRLIHPTQFPLVEKALRVWANRQV